MTPHSSNSRLCIVVLGYLVRCPIGGMAWHHLQYAMGLKELGHDVLFLEDSNDCGDCYDPTRHVTDEDPTYGLKFAEEVFGRTGLGERWAYHDAHTSRWHGPLRDQVAEICDSADLMLNLSGSNPIRPWTSGIPRRALVDTDPAFEQVRQITDPERRKLALGHNLFFSFGENVGTPRSKLPDDGLAWRPTRQPIVLDAWPAGAGPAGGKYTSVMQWWSYPPREYDGVRYGLKADSFEPYLDLPRRTSESFELALGSPGAPREELISMGWELVDPLATTRTPWTYQRYIQQSKAEFSIAKHGYVIANTGWFSERSAAYLASGRPVLAQDTGFSEVLKSDGGLIPFRSPEEALLGIEEVGAKYEEHCHAARRVAEEYFDSRKVLTSLIDRSMGSE